MDYHMPILNGLQVVEKVRAVLEKNPDGWDLKGIAQPYIAFFTAY